MAQQLGRMWIWARSAIRSFSRPPAGFPLGANVTSRVTDSIIRGGISYHFSAGPGYY